MTEEKSYVHTSVSGFIFQSYVKNALKLSVRDLLLIPVRLLVGNSNWQGSFPCNGSIPLHWRIKRNMDVFSSCNT